MELVRRLLGSWALYSCHFHPPFVNVNIYFFFSFFIFFLLVLCLILLLLLLLLFIFIPFGLSFASSGELGSWHTTVCVVLMIIFAYNYINKKKI